MPTRRPRPLTHPPTSSPAAAARRGPLTALAVVGVLLLASVSAPGAAWEHQAEPATGAPTVGAVPASGPGIGGAVDDPVDARAATAATAPPGGSSPAVRPGFRLPVPAGPGGRGSVLRPFRAPAHRYGPGHRGVDLALGGASTTVRAPADGVVAFAGMVAGRPVLAIDHGDGWRSAIEPVVAAVGVGQRVSAGAPIGTAGAAPDPPAPGSPSAAGPRSPGAGHCVLPCLHWGVRHHGRYVDPLTLARTRIVLLPGHRLDTWPPRWHRRGRR